MDLKRSAISGVRWAGATTAYTLAVQFAQVAVLAHSLSVEALGLVSLVMVTVGFTQGFADAGLVQAIVQRQDGDDRALSTPFWVIALLGAALTAAVALLAEPIARFYEAPDLAELLVGVAPVFAAGAMAHVPAAILQRGLRFSALTGLDALCQTVGTAVVIGGVLAGKGPMAIVYGLVVSALLRSVVLLAAVWPSWRPSLRLRGADLSGTIAFGLYQTGERGVNFLSANVDYVIIGRLLGPSALGPYYVAYQMAVLPVLKVNPVLTRVAFPVFSRVQEDAAVLRRGYVAMARLIALVGFPALVGLAVTAPVAVPLLFGESWPTVPGLAQLLVPVGLFKGLANPLGSIFLARGRADLGFRWNVVSAAVNAAVFSAVAAKGTHAVALAYVLTAGGSFFAGQVVLRRLIGLSFGDYFPPLVRPLFMSAAMGIVVALAEMGVGGLTVSRLHLLLFLATLGGSVYLLLAVRLERELLHDIRGWVAGR